MFAKCISGKHPVTIRPTTINLDTLATTKQTLFSLTQLVVVIGVNTLQLVSFIINPDK